MIGPKASGTSSRQTTLASVTSRLWLQGNLCRGAALAPTHISVVAAAQDKAKAEHIGPLARHDKVKSFHLQHGGRQAVGQIRVFPLEMSETEAKKLLFAETTHAGSLQVRQGSGEIIHLVTLLA